MLPIFVTQEIEKSLLLTENHNSLSFVKIASIKDRYWLLDLTETPPIDATVYLIHHAIYKNWVIEQQIRLQEIGAAQSVTKLAIALGLGEGVLWFLLKNILPASGLIFAVSLGTALFDYALKWSNKATEQQDCAELFLLITFDMLGDMLGSDVSSLLTKNPLFTNVLAPALGSSITFAVANSLLKLIKTEERTLLDHKKNDEPNDDIESTNEKLKVSNPLIKKRHHLEATSSCSSRFFAHESTGFFIADFASGSATEVVSQKVYDWLMTMMPKPAAMLLTAIITGITTSVTFGSLYGLNRQWAKNSNKIPAPQKNGMLFDTNTNKHYGTTTDEIKLSQ